MPRKAKSIAAPKIVTVNQFINNLRKGKGSKSLTALALKSSPQWKAIRAI